MIINPMMIYLFGIANNIETFFTVATLLMVSTTIIFMCVFFVQMDEEPPCGEKSLKLIKKIIKFLIPISFITILGAVFTPDTKTLLEMYTIPSTINEISNNKQMQQLPDNLLKFINGYLEENTIKHKGTN